MRPWRSFTFWTGFLIISVGTAIPPVVPLYKGSQLIGWWPLWLAYFVGAFDFLAPHLFVSGLLALAVWVLVQRSRR